MSHIENDEDKIRNTRNTARFFTENTHIAWVVLIAVMLWGVYGYFHMAKRKDPDIPVRKAVAVTTWPGVSADKVEQLVTRRIEEKIAEVRGVDLIESISRSSVSVVYVELDENQKLDTVKTFADVKLKLDEITDFPSGVNPIDFIRDFGDTAALMLTIASPRVSDIDIDLRAREIRQAVEDVRSAADPKQRSGLPTVTGVVCFPRSVDPAVLRRHIDLLTRSMAASGVAKDVRRIEGSGFIGLDAATDLSDVEIRDFVLRFSQEYLHSNDLHPDVWNLALIRDSGQTRTRIAEVAGAKYSYRELKDFSSLIRRTLQGVPQVSKISTSGVLPENIFLDYSQERLSAYGLQLSQIADALAARNILAPGGVIEAGGRNIYIDPSGEFADAKEIETLRVGTSASGAPLYLRDIVDVERGYKTPPSFLNYYLAHDADSGWSRNRAVTLAVQMRPGEQIGHFAVKVNQALADLQTRLPNDLIIAKTSDQPLQVEEEVDLFMLSLYEAIVLVVLVAFIGFWEWRSALLMALSIPITLAMTFGMMHALGIDLQQVSIGSLIIALGLLVDDPVVAGDAIKRELDAGRPAGIAAWLGPTKLAQAIMYATITNIVAYLPLLLLPGDVGRFIYSLPIVLACSLGASRIVSMTFIPLLAKYILRGNPARERDPHAMRRHGFAGFYYRTGAIAIEHRKKVLLGALVFLAAGALFSRGLITQFFPKDLSYLSYIDIWLPEDAPLSSTDAAAAQAERIVTEVAAQYGQAHPDSDGKPRAVLKSVTTFSGGGGPRFWFSVSPELNQLNYAQLVIQVADKHDSTPLVAPLQAALTERIPGARIDVRQLETGKPVGMPVSVRISGEDHRTLRQLAERVAGVFRQDPDLHRLRDDWGGDNLTARLNIDADRANASGLTNYDVAASSATGISGRRIGALRDGEDLIPITARLRAAERAKASDIENLYVYSTQTTQRVPLAQISGVDFSLQPEKIRRRAQFPTITVGGFPASGVLPSQIMAKARPGLEAIRAELPPGYKMSIGGEQEEQVKGFGGLAVAMVVSIVCIFIALVVQFRHAVKPFLVFAAIPFGMVGAVAALYIMRAPFGFMAFLGVASLIGVIVSHIIVLFDFIEEMRERGEPLREALLDAGVIRLRPVLITVGATVFGLFPLAGHGGPLWEPMCYTQIGGLTLATLVTLGLVPVLYAIFVLDLKIIAWKPGHAADADAP